MPIAMKRLINFFSDFPVFLPPHFKIWLKMILKSVWIFFSDHSRFWYLWWIVPKAINYSRKYIWWWVWRRLGYRKRKWCWLALWRSKFQPRVRTAPQGDCQAKIVKKATKCDSIHEGSSQYWWWSRSYSFSKFLP